MQLQVFAIRDCKTEQFGNPMYLITAQQAIRGMGEEINNAESKDNLHKYPEDYALYSLGTFNTDNGEFEIHKPRLIIEAKDLVKPTK